MSPGRTSKGRPRGAGAARVRAEARRTLGIAARRPEVSGAIGVQRIGAANGGPTAGLLLGISSTLPFSARRANARATQAEDAEVIAAVNRHQATDKGFGPALGPEAAAYAIGAFERLLIVTFVLVNAIAAVGFVIAAKTLARFKQLDDRGFAEYYLLGTLASASVAIGSALVAQAALATIP